MIRIASAIALTIALGAPLNASQTIVTFEDIDGLAELTELGISFSGNFTLWNGGNCSVIDDPNCGPVSPPFGVCVGPCGGESGFISLAAPASRFAIWALSGPGPDPLSVGTVIVARNANGEVLATDAVTDPALPAQELVVEGKGISSVELFSPIVNNEAWDQMSITVERDACDADLDGSGDIGFSDLLSVLNAWGDCDGCPEDIDGSGNVGFDDLLAVISAWGTC